MVKKNVTEPQDATEAQAARDRADAWARSVPGTAYGVTEPVLSGEVTEFQRTHPEEKR
jgi:hypothetical protein